MTLLIQYTIIFASVLLLVALALSLRLALATLTNRDDVPIEPPNL